MARPPHQSLGRASRTGRPMDWDELPVGHDRKALGPGLPRSGRTCSNSPHLYAELAIRPRRRYRRPGAQIAGRGDVTPTATARKLHSTPTNTPRRRAPMTTGSPSGHPGTNPINPAQPWAATPPRAGLRHRRFRSDVVSAPRSSNGRRLRDAVSTADARHARAASPRGLTTAAAWLNQAPHQDRYRGRRDVAVVVAVPRR